jgi:hypothetical protein
VFVIVGVSVIVDVKVGVNVWVLVGIVVGVLVIVFVGNINSTDPPVTVTGMGVFKPYRGVFCGAKVATILTGCVMATGKGVPLPVMVTGCFKRLTFWPYAEFKEAKKANKIKVIFII